MIAYLTGTLLAKNLRDVVVLVGGVGYKISMPLAEFSRLGPSGEQVALHIHTYVREDAIDLYGFLEPSSLKLFENLIQVSGIGPKLALAMLSSMDSNTLISAVLANDHQALTRIPGIGAKSAQRIVLELKDRLKKLTDLQPTSFGTLDDLRSAMANLGYKSQSVDKAIQSVESMAKAGHPLENLIKEALKRVQ